MRLEKMTYSSRSGYTIQLRQTDCMVLNPDDVYLLFLLSQAQLTQSELDEHFSEEEQAVLHRYEEQTFNKRVDLANKNQSYSKLPFWKKAVRAHFDIWMEVIPQGVKAVMERIYGWQIRSLMQGANMTEHMILSALKEGRTDKAYYNMLLRPSSWGEASPELIQELEERFGPFER